MEFKKFKEKLALVNGKIWVAIFCGSFYSFCFFLLFFTEIGRTIMNYLGYVLFSLVGLIGVFNLYELILKKLGIFEK